MKYVDFLELQKEYESRKETIQELREAFKAFTEIYNSKGLNWMDSKTSKNFRDFEDTLKEDIERLKKELNEMEI